MTMPTFKTVAFTRPKSNPVQLSDFLNFDRDLELVINQLLAIPMANAKQAGYLNYPDWVTFNSKVSTVTATVPLKSTGGSNPVISMPVAAPGQAGYVPTPPGGTTTFLRADMTYAAASGPTGPQGPAGSMGLFGDDGNDGNDGIHGMQGAQGLQGLQGIQGYPGPMGRDGEDGDDGAQGVPGQAGVQGIQGLQGFQGLTGPPGLSGDDGEAGADGFYGLQGPQGPAGSLTNPIAANTLLGNNTGSPAAPTALTVAQVNAMLGSASIQQIAARVMVRI